MVIALELKIQFWEGFHTNIAPDMGAYYIAIKNGTFIWFEFRLILLDHKNVSRTAGCQSTFCYILTYTMIEMIGCRAPHPHWDSTFLSTILARPLLIPSITSFLTAGSPSTACLNCLTSSTSSDWRIDLRCWKSACRFFLSIFFRTFGTGLNLPRVRAAPPAPPTKLPVYGDIN